MMAELLFYACIFAVAFYRYHLKSDHGADYPVNDDRDFARYDPVIGKLMAYYRALSPAGKRRFISRTIKISKHLDIQGREDFEITDEVRVLLSASIAQLTFGFENPRLPFIEGIIVFPDTFYSRLARSHVKGLALSNGAVFLSWPDFLKGYENNSDTYNLGLHEFTHMLKMQSDDLFASDQRLTEHFHTWEEIAHPAFISLRNGNNDFFREYGATNETEFFSVCVENFFEVPDAFEQKLPELYYHLCYLLRQNPLNASNDYVLNDEDVKIINEKITVDLPVYNARQSSREYRFWKFISSVFLLIILIDLTIFMQVPVKTQLFVGRGLLVSIVIFMGIRWHYYSNASAAFQSHYLNHLLLKLLPLLCLVLFIIS